MAADDRCGLFSVAPRLPHGRWTVSRRPRLAVRTECFDEDLSRYQGAGFPSAFSGVYKSTRFAYLDTSPALGFMLELVEARR